jgi:hypothetical protein
MFFIKISKIFTISENNSHFKNTKICFIRCVFDQVSQKIKIIFCLTHTRGIIYHFLYIHENLIISLLNSRELD